MKYISNQICDVITQGECKRFSVFCFHTQMFENSKNRVGFLLLAVRSLPDHLGLGIHEVHGSHASKCVLKSLPGRR